MSLSRLGERAFMKETVLIVEDEKEIADLLEIYFANDGYNVLKFYNGMDAFECLSAEGVDIALLDVMLPDISGFQLCQKIRDAHFFPIIMLTAMGEDTDKIKGLTLGADDYITKPFNPLEVVARVKTQLRRHKKYNSSKQAEDRIEDESAEYDIRGLYIEKNTHTCRLYGESIRLTPIEFSILFYLCQNLNKVVSSEELFEAVWKEKFYENNNTVMAHVARLREKLKEPPRKPKFVKTVWGVGYKIEK